MTFALKIKFKTKTTMKGFNRRNPFPRYTQIRIHLFFVSIIIVLSLTIVILISNRFYAI